jgi:cytochrome c oxidase subunit 2
MTMFASLSTMTAPVTALVASVQGQEPQYQIDPTFMAQLPPQASTFATDMDPLFIFVWVVCAFFFFLILGVLFYSAVKYRRVSEDQAPASNATHNTALEIAWTIIPLIIVMVVFAWGFYGAKDMLVAPADAHNVRVVASQWKWEFTHPGASAPATNELWVPWNEDVKLTTSSMDVLHSFSIPAMRVKRDVLPGRNQVVWFRPTKLGDFQIFCTEYCGASHSQMLATLHVVPRDEWDAAPWNTRPEDPVEWGQILYKNNCATCHTIDGSKLVGPSFLGIWGREGATEDGEKYVVDDEYFAESVRYPQAKIVKGYKGQVMTQFPEDGPIDADALDALKQYLQTLTN